MTSRNSRRASGQVVFVCAWLLGALAVPPAAARAQGLAGLLIDGEDWQLVAEGFAFTEGPAVDPEGRLYFTDVFRGKIYRLDDDGKAEVFVDGSGGANGLMFGPDGRLYACQNGAKKIVAFDSSGKAETIVDDVKSNDLVVTRTGAIYFTDPENHQVWYVSPSREKRVVDRGLGYPNGLILWPDQATLVVADMRGMNLWAYRVEADGSLKFKQPFYTLRVPEGKTDSGADGMTIDDQGRIYVTSHLGLQVFDTQGRLTGVLAKPQVAWLANAVFAGPELDTLYVTCTNRVYKRKVHARGIRYFDAAEAK
jgi:sugar lactone lactonase YvrE